MPYQKGTATNYLTMLDDLVDFATSQGATVATVAAGGTGYVVGDILTVSGGTSTSAATFEVLTLSGSAVATVKVREAGGYTSTPGNPASTTGGTGSGCTLTVTWASNGWTLKRETQEAVSATVSAGGTGYSVNDQLTIVGGVDVVTAAVFNVDTVSGGVVTAVSLVTKGKYAETPTNPASTTVAPAGGSGCTLTVTWQGATSTDKEFLLDGAGAGSDNIYVGIRTFNDSGGTGAYNWELAGMTGYDNTKDFKTQPGLSPGRWDGASAAEKQGAYMALRNSSIDYWFFVNARRIIVVAKLGTTYTSMYLGWLNPFGTSTEYPYPLLVGGCTGQWDRLFSATDPDLSGICDPVGGNNHANGPFFLRDPGGTWKSWQNSRRSGVGRNAQEDRIMTPTGAPDLSGVETKDKATTESWTYTDMVPNIGWPGTPVFDLIQTPATGDDLTIIIPTMLIEIDPAQQALGELADVFWHSILAIPTNISAEDTITIGSDVYICFQSGNRSDKFAFFCVLRG